MEALNIASATNADVDTISVASPAAFGPLSPSYNVEAKPVTRLPRPNKLQVQHCIRGRGATDIIVDCALCFSAPHLQYLGLQPYGEWGPPFPSPPSPSPKFKKKKK